ncbi:MAG TPA: hypothetical protein VE994_15945, partial [Terriglobales bacterium]|nr:hypothetical protein [Terriglobales bacterium]
DFLAHHPTANGATAGTLLRTPGTLHSAAGATGTTVISAAANDATSVHASNDDSAVQLKFDYIDYGPEYAAEYDSEHNTAADHDAAIPAGERHPAT